MKITHRLTIQVGAALLLVMTVSGASLDRQDDDDGEAQATELHGADLVQAHSKYFQYAHVPHKDHYEVGHRRGNDHHFIEKHEKAHPHAGEFKTKVRWGDKHGGYGEHYWDYNHDGGHHGDASDEGTEQNEQFVEYDDAPARQKRHDQDQPSYVFDPETGHVIDQNTGRSFTLHPVY